MAETAQPAVEIRALLRRRLIDARTAIAPADKALQDAAIMTNLESWLDRHAPAWTASSGSASSPDNRAVLGVYWPIRAEPDLRPLYDRLAARGIGLALPVMTAPDAPLLFAKWEMSMPMAIDRWGIATPQSVTPVDPAALLVPCVGFNARGYRLGYGGGFYDRTLAARSPRPFAIGIACEAARCDFASAAHDMPMDVVLTETPPA